MRIPSRRRILAAGTLTVPLLATGCKGIGALGTPPRPLADVAVAREAIAREELLIARYGEVLAAVPALAGTLRPIVAQHRDHLARLRSRLIVPRAGGQPTGRPTATATAGGQASAGPPGTAAAALTYLQDAERAAAAALVSHLQAASPTFAQLLASIAASEATHALVLGSHGRVA